MGAPTNPCVSAEDFRGLVFVSFFVRVDTVDYVIFVGGVIFASARPMGFKDLVGLGDWLFVRVLVGQAVFLAYALSVGNHERWACVIRRVEVIREGVNEVGAAR